MMMEYLIGYAFQENGYRKESDYYFTISIERYKKKINTDNPGGERYYLYRLAGIYAYRGEKRKAYEYLNRYSQAPIFYSEEVQLIKCDPLFNSLRDEPEFQKIVQIIKKKYQAEHERVGKWY